MIPEPSYLEGAIVPCLEGYKEVQTLLFLLLKQYQFAPNKPANVQSAYWYAYTVNLNENFLAMVLIGNETLS